MRRTWGITQSELGRKVGLAHDTISLWENGYTELEESDKKRLLDELHKLVDGKRAKLGLPREKGVPLNSLATVIHYSDPVKKQRDVAAKDEGITLRDEIIANQYEIIANSKEIIKELQQEIARLELLNKEIGESEDGEIQALRKHLEQKKHW